MTTSNEFVTARFPDGAVARTSNRANMRRRVHRFIPPGSEARLREAGEDFGAWRPEREIVPRILQRVDRMGVGPKLIVQRRRDMDQLSIREVAVLFVPDLGASPEIELLSAEIVDHFGMTLLRDGGLYVCRFVDGTTTVSKHGYVEAGGGWKGTARDWFVKAGGMPKLEEVYRFSVARIKAHDWNGAHAIVNQTIYTHPSGEARYTGVQHFHLHNDVPRGVPCK